MTRKLNKMSRITLNSKCRLCRAEGVKLYLKNTRCLSGKCPVEKKGAVPPGMHGIRRVKKPTDYGIQLRAKQKAKRIYGVQEKQFKNYFLKAKKLSGLVGDNLLSLLAKRLDNIIYISSLSSSRSNAKQLISHNHVSVNDKPLNVSSYSVKVGDVISVSKKYMDVEKEKDQKIPDWLQPNKSSHAVTMLSNPSGEDIKNDIDINLIVEYYSR